MTPVIALEVEWYLVPLQEVAKPEAYVQDFISYLTNASRENQLVLHSISPEKGLFQVEAALHPEKDINLLINKYESLLTLIKRSASIIGAAVDFSAKPKADDYGSGIHIHVHLEDEKGRSVFYKTEEGLSAPLRHSIGGLLATMEASLPVFLPSPASWERIVPGFHAPVNGSWGFNNRTTAIRLPDGVGEYQGATQIAQHAPGYYKRIEHRVAGSDADVKDVIAAILAGIDKGLSQKVEPPPAIYGNADDAQYGLRKFVKGD